MNALQRIYAVLAIALVVTVVVSVAAVGVISATGPPVAVGNAGTGNIGVPGEPVSVDFKGCGAVWFIYQDTSVLPQDVTVTIHQGGTSTTVTVTVTDSDLETVGAYSDPLYKFTTDGGRIISASVSGGPTVENPSPCAQAV